MTKLPINSRDWASHRSPRNANTREPTHQPLTNHTHQILHRAARYSALNSARKPKWTGLEENAERDLDLLTAVNLIVLLGGDLRTNTQRRRHRDWTSARILASSALASCIAARYPTPKLEVPESLWQVAVAMDWDRCHDRRHTARPASPPWERCSRIHTGEAQLVDGRLSLVRQRVVK